MVDSDDALSRAPLTATRSLSPLLPKARRMEAGVRLSPVACCPPTRLRMAQPIVCP